MTQFWRNGFWRRSKYGMPHWVEGHWVDRDDWDRTGSTYASGGYFRGKLLELDADRGATSTFVVPNAHCPACGAAVFFYQNEWGSKVYFDELGPPWPKHPCTDHAEQRTTGGKQALPNVLPPIRNEEEISAIRSWLGYAGLDPQQDFFETYKLSQWAAFRVAARARARSETLIVLDPVGSEGRRMYVALKKTTARALDVGTLVFYFRSWISHFDLTSMSGVETEVRRLNGAIGFVNELVASQDRSSDGTGER